MAGGGLSQARIAQLVLEHFWPETDPRTETGRMEVTRLTQRLAAIEDRLSKIEKRVAPVDG